MRDSLYLNTTFVHVELKIWIFFIPADYYLNTTFVHVELQESIDISDDPFTFKYNICTCRANAGDIIKAIGKIFKYNICTCRAIKFNLFSWSVSNLNTTFVHVELYSPLFTS